MPLLSTPVNKIRCLGTVLGRASLTQAAIGFFIWFFVGVPLVLLFLQFGLRYVITYRLTDTSLQITLLGLLPIVRIRYDSVQELKRISLREATFNFPPWRGSDYRNRIFGNAVLVVRKRKRPVLLSPDDAEEFMREVGRRVYGQTGRLPPGS